MFSLSNIYIQWDTNVFVDSAMNFLYDIGTVFTWAISIYFFIAGLKMIKSISDYFFK